MSGISTHILDTSTGKPVSGVEVRLTLADASVGSGRTDHDGRIRALLPEGTALRRGCYQLTFDIATYFPQGFYPEVVITFAVRETTEHYHVPLLIGPFGYTTYRGS
jgi:5-hydroxyisourate hydrolase